MFTKLWMWLKSLFSKGKAEMDNISNSSIPAAEVVPAPVVAVINDAAAAAALPVVSAVEGDIAKVENVVTTAVATADDAIDGVVSEIKKLLDLYKHDIPIWDEVVALAKKV